MAIGLGTTQAESLTLSGYTVEALPSAQGGQIVRTNSTGTARGTFSGAAGDYLLSIAYYDESDGLSTLSVRVNGAVVASWTNNETLGASAGPNTLRTRIIPVNLPDGALIEIIGTRNSGEHARFDYISVAPLDGSDASAPTVSGVAADMTAAAASHTVRVTYTDPSGIDPTSIDISDLTVTGGPSPVTVTGVTTQGNGSQVMATYTLASGSDGFTAADNGQYTVALKDKAVSDTAGNSAPGIASLDTFAVSIGTTPAFAPVGVGTTQAEVLTRSNYAVEAAAFAQGGQLVRVPSGTGTAKGSFTGPAGAYLLKIAYYDENDGSATMTVRVNGVVVSTWTLNQNLGSASAGPSTLQTKAIPVTLASGAAIEITGTRNNGEHSRFDYISVEPADGSDAAPPSVSGVAADVNAAAASHVVTVTYTDASGINPLTIDASDLMVTGPSGASPITVTKVETQGSGTQVIATYTLSSGVDGFTTADNGSYTVALNDKAVSDSNGNTTAAVATLDTFAVNVAAVGEPDQIYVTWPYDPATTLTVVWQTDGASTPSDVQYRVQGQADWNSVSGSVRPSGTVGVLHEVTLSGLQPGTEIEYRVWGDNGDWSDVQTVRTAPSEDAPFDFIFFADTGLIGRLDGLATGTEQAINVIDVLDPDFVLGGGDYAYFNTDTRFGTLDATIDAWFAQWKPVIADAPFMPTWGNHEVHLGENVQSWAARVPTPVGYTPRQTYSFDVGDVHFVSIRAAEETTALTSAQLTWVRNDIEAAWAQGAKWVIPYMHVPAYSDGTSHPSNLALRNQLAPLFDELNVKIVLTTHDQSYERTLPLEGNPSQAVPTSTHLGPYSADTDGIVWLKVSPTGKLSNKGGVDDFSHFRTDPPPSYTAVRDDQNHHFARFEVDAQDNITVEIWALRGDGTAAFVIDEFTYNLGERVTPPVETTAPTAVGGAADVTAIAATHAAVVTYTDAGSGINVASIGANDLAVAGPGAVTVTGVSTQVNGNGSVTATYTLSSPGGFTAADNGLHTVSLVAGAVADLAGNGVAGGALDTFTVNLPTSILPPIGLGTTEAEGLSTTNYAVVSLASAQGGQILRVPSGAGTAKGTFTGETGEYVLTVGYYDENDGQSTMSAKVNGTVMATWSLDRDLGSPDANPGTFATKAIPVSLATGAVLEITGTRNNGEHSRFDYITISSPLSEIIAPAASAVAGADFFLV